MKWHELQTTSVKNRTRVGRGIGSGHGKTSGRGTKGQGSRAGGGVRPGFEGGQNPLYKRLPKQPGFTSHRPPVQLIHTDQLNQFKAGAKVDIASLKAVNLVSRLDRPVRLVARGKLEKKLDITLQGASQPAAQAIAKAGGKLSLAKLPPFRTAKSSTKPKQA